MITFFNVLRIVLAIMLSTIAINDKNKLYLASCMDFKVKDKINTQKKESWFIVQAQFILHQTLQRDKVTKQLLE